MAISGLLRLALILSTCSVCYARECRVTVPDDCHTKCMNYAVNHATKCLTCDCVAVEGLWEKDIKLDGETEEILSLYLNGKSKAGSKYARRWFEQKNGDNWEVPYVVNSALNSVPAAKRAIEAAIADYHTQTCIRFVPRTNEINYINFIQSDGCWSYVGMKRSSRNDVSIGYGCELKGTVIHELMHALGFWHEQSRPDRDNYIRIVTKNIYRSMLHNFQKYSTHDIESYGSGYDVGSIMHYPNWAFSKNGRDTITLANGKPFTSYQRSDFSASDIAQINAMYQCNSGVATTAATTTEAATTTAAKKCADKHKACRNLAKRRKCKNRKLRSMCPASCKACRSNGDVCEDGNSFVCNSMKHLCDVSESVADKCMKTCGNC